MVFRLTRLVAASPAALLVSLGACANADKTEASENAAAPKETIMAQPAGEDGVANLPYARGRIFYSLDEYLTYLEKQGAIDLPYWREVKPGLYEHVVRMPEAKPEFASREELMQRFGFKR